MSFKLFIKERNNRLNTLNTFKEIILDDTHNYRKILSKNGISSTQDIFKIFMSLGYKAYKGGDLDTFDFFMSLLFEIYDTQSLICKKRVLKEISNLGLMSAHNHYGNTFQIILEKYKEHLLLNAETNTFKQHLNIMRDWALISLTNNYVEGVLDVVYVYRDLKEHFEKSCMEMCNTYLKNAIINLMYLTEKYKQDDIRGQILPEINYILEYENIEIKPIITMENRFNVNACAENKESEKDQEIEV